MKPNEKAEAGTFFNIFSFDRQSLKFKLVLYFVLFAVLLMSSIWFLQVFFLKYYYENMKISETTRVARLISANYGDENFMENLEKLTAGTDLQIHIESTGEYAISTTQPIYTYLRELTAVRAELARSQSNSISVILTDVHSIDLLAYACYLEKSPENVTALYILSPLYPVESTLSILKNQLIYVTIISLLVAFGVSIYLASRITRPIRNITDSAKELAKGNYGIKFKGEHYSELINLADTLTYTSLSLEKAGQMQNDLIANVSHDLRTPLTMVKSYAEMVRDISGDNPAKRNEHLQVIIDEADRLNLLVSDMLTMSKMQSGVNTLNRSVFSIKSAVDSIISSYEILTTTEGYTILSDCDNIYINADEAKIKQVVSNLMTNAVKYCGNDRTIYVSAKKKQGKMRLEVIDHGMGIEPDELELIWDKYYKASTNHVRATAGTGLGLSIVKSILSLHNAEFGVNSKVGQGTTFWFELPITHKAVSQKKLKKSKAPTASN